MKPERGAGLLFSCVSLRSVLHLLAKEEPFARRGAFLPCTRVVFRYSIACLACGKKKIRIY